MTGQRSDPLATLCVPDLDFSFARSDRERVALNSKQSVKSREMSDRRTRGKGGRPEREEKEEEGTHSSCPANTRHHVPRPPRPTLNTPIHPLRPISPPRPKVAKHRHPTRIRAPHVHARTQSNPQYIRRAPVDEVQVVVVR